MKKTEMQKTNNLYLDCKKNINIFGDKQNSLPLVNHFTYLFIFLIGKNKVAGKDIGSIL